MLHNVINPATEEVVGSVELFDTEQTDEAIARSRKAFASWRAVAPGDRARLLRRFAEAVDADREHLAQLEVANSGHTIGNARWEAGNARDVIAYYSGAPERLIGQQIPVADGIDVTFHEPLGVVGVIVPWNFPMPIASWGFAPALAAGNTVVLKPAELTPFTAIRLAELALEAGMPEDVFQVLPGKGSVVGQRFVDHRDVAKIVFTGSTEVGRQVMAGCAAQIKPVTLELGGKSANVVFADCDLEAAAATAPYAVFDNAGQDCCARSRILVERSAYDRFLELLEPAVQGVVVTDPCDEKAEMGPLISAEQRERVRGLRARRRAGRVPRHRAGRAGLLVPADRPHPDATRPTARCTRRSSARSSRRRRSTTRPTRSASRTTATSACPVRSGRATSAARCGSAAASRPATSASTRTRRCATGRRSAGSSRPASAANSARTRRSRSPRPRTSSSRRRSTDEAGLTARSRSSPVRAAGSAWPPRAGSPRRARRSSASTSTPTRDSARPTRSAASSSRSTSPTRSRCATCSRASSTQHGGLHIAFNNAGISPPDDDSILTTGIDAWERVQRVNLTSVYLCCKYAIEHMRAGGGGSIINTASFVAVLGSATSQISYTASKGGVLAMSRELGVQFAREGIRVNALCPGPINTPLLQELFAKDPERAARRMVHIPMGRFGEADEIAAAVTFLASDDASFITASTFLVDGGISGAYVTPE